MLLIRLFVLVRQVNRGKNCQHLSLLVYPSLLPYSNTFQTCPAKVNAVASEEAVVSVVVAVVAVSSCVVT